MSKSDARPGGHVASKEGSPHEEEAHSQAHAWEPAEPEGAARVLRATMAAPGLACGPAWFWEVPDLDAASRPAGDTGSELADLRGALSEARRQLLDLARGDLNPVQRGLFDAHASLVEDPELTAEAESLVREGNDALSAWNTAISARAARVQALADAHLAQRADDFRDVGRRITMILLGLDPDPFENLGEPVVLLADDLEPSRAAQLEPDRILGICLRKGSPNAHSAIVAGSLGIPMLVAAGSALDEVETGQLVILDASGGRLIVEPCEADIDSARRTISEFEARRDVDREHRFEPAILTDGHRVEVVANAASLTDIRAALDAGAEGIGLLRTEFLFLDREQPPTENEQYQVLCEMIEVLHGRPMIVRTMDIGGDKPVSYLGLSELDLSPLGLRGIRLALARPDLARTQLRAIYRAARHGPIRLMFPMIATPNDFLRAREMADMVSREIGGPEIELGVMIEVPSAVVMAPEIAELADFFSIGTNDLTQYSLAIDRTHPLLACRADSLHPVVLRLVRPTVEGAHDKGKRVGVCGGLAADPLGALILTGLGIDELSVPPALVPQIKALLRREDLSTLSALATEALAQRDARAVRALRPQG